MSGMTENTLAEQIANGMRRDILLGKLKPGALIKERDSSHDLGVSRTPLREAIRILASEGLVNLRPARSPVVADPSLREISDNLVVISVLEVLGAKLACTHATEAELQAIEAQQALMLELSDTADAVTYFEADMKFHRMITEASHNAALIDSHRAYMARLWRPRFLAASQRHDRPRVLRQHGEVVVGLRNRDEAHVIAEVDSHMRHLTLNVTSIFEAKERAAE